MKDYYVLIQTDINKPAKVSNKVLQFHSMNRFGDHRG
jgi:hypothetical protein